MVGADLFSGFSRRCGSDHFVRARVETCRATRSQNRLVRLAFTLVSPEGEFRIILLAPCFGVAPLLAAMILIQAIGRPLCHLLNRSIIFEPPSMNEFSKQLCLAQLVIVTQRPLIEQ
jgi:hypothetical protein